MRCSVCKCRLIDSKELIGADVGWLNYDQYLKQDNDYGGTGSCRNKTRTLINHTPESTEETVLKLLAKLDDLQALPS